MPMLLLDKFAAGSDDVFRQDQILEGSPRGDLNEEVMSGRGECQIRLRTLTAVSPRGSGCFGQSMSQNAMIFTAFFGDDRLHRLPEERLVAGSPCFNEVL